jgi:hypothetical protein
MSCRSRIQSSQPGISAEAPMGHRTTRRRHPRSFRQSPFCYYQSVDYPKNKSKSEYHAMFDVESHVGCDLPREHPPIL